MPAARRPDTDPQGVAAWDRRIFMTAARCGTVVPSFRIRQAEYTN